MSGRLSCKSGMAFGLALLAIASCTMAIPVSDDGEVRQQSLQITYRGADGQQASQVLDHAYYCSTSSQAKGDLRPMGTGPVVSAKKRRRVVNTWPRYDVLTVFDGQLLVENICRDDDAPVHIFGRPFYAETQADQLRAIRLYHLPPLPDAGTPSAAPAQPVLTFSAKPDEHTRLGLAATPGEGLNAIIGADPATRKRLTHTYKTLTDEAAMPDWLIRLEPERRLTSTEQERMDADIRTRRQTLLEAMTLVDQVSAYTAPDRAEFVILLNQRNEKSPKDGT